VDLTAYRATERERERTQSLLRLLVPGDSVLEIGARDGHFSKLLPDYFREVTALDLTKPQFDIERVRTVAGDVRSLEFEDRSFDCVFCTEVLEHVNGLDQATAEIRRVAKKRIIIGVPYCQDIRWGRTTCKNCLEVSPGWGHVHSFDERKLMRLFPEFSLQTREFVSSNKERTNALSTWLFDLAGNPWGKYNDEDKCLHCGSTLTSPVLRNLPQRGCSALATALNQLQGLFVKPWPLWIHLALQRNQS
jgi:SAM-dependent methyltransferase